MTSTLTDVTAEQLDLNEAECCAVLPYWPIWAAAQFATTDEAKALLQFVHVWADESFIQIESTDGHRAFRYQLPTVLNNTQTVWRIPEGGLLLYAKDLKKAVSYAKLLTVTQEMRAVFHGGKKTQLDELSSVNLAGHYSIRTAEDCSKVGEYPRINQLFPDQFTNAPNKEWGFNARYLKEWSAVVEKLSDNSVTRIKSNGAFNPFVFTANYVPCIGQHFSDARLEMLLMPVQFRD